MPQRSVLSWNALVTAYAHSGHRREAVIAFQEMELEGFKPDEAGLMSVITACGHIGLLSHGCRYLSRMESDCGVAPLREHYCRMIDVLGKIGLLAEAEELIESMPYEPNLVELVSLLGACDVHRDRERGARVAERVAGIDPSSAAPYLILANLSSERKKKRLARTLKQIG
ncbi:hypothetical protein SELMODRAFT_135764 [Selaginella moellendorffii]|uniref:Pentacotripeptide-repeat region of PRORP domain-containing protein n=2 Tax=Selaginella moellendorffii TaxID=88036 RepID=D8TAN6_SELML|nr:hypothetical protein SELMODRAFT_135764 [Selaginella moellendorffii]